MLENPILGKNGKKNYNRRFRNIVDRSGELYDLKKGLGMHDPKALSKKEKEFEEERIGIKTWLEEETVELMKLLETGKSLILRGETGSGKSSLIYGIRQKFRINGTSYYYIDGHFHTASQASLIRKIRMAGIKKCPILWDSFDYLVAGNKITRKISLPEHRAKSKALLEALDDFLSNGGQLIATSHNDEWVAHNSDPEIYGSAVCQSVYNKVQNYQVKGVFENTEARKLFYDQYIKDSPKISDYLTNLVYNQNFIEYLEREYPSQALNVLNSLKTYRMSKMLIKDSKKQNISAISAIEVFIQSGSGEELVWKEIVRFVIEKENYLKTWHIGTK